MYFQGLPKDEILSKKRFESYEDSSKQNQIRMVTLFGQQVYTTSDSDLRLPENHESVECREFHSNGCSQDNLELRFPLRIEAYGTNLFGKKSENVNISDGSALLDLNKTPVYEPVSSDHQCFFQDLNLPHTEEAKMSCEKSGLDGVHEKDNEASPASCCTAENNSRTEGEDSYEVIQTAAECLVHISAVSLDKSQDFLFKPRSRSNSSSQNQEFLNKHEMDVEEPGRSCDSFELHTLGVRETIPEELCCVSSKAIDDFSNKKEVGVKLRRGRRMKNFQKEILPGLVPLSRHEIHEDINILEAVLRSRDYKKMQGKTKDGKCKPNARINNKGLTQRYVGRRRRQTG